MKPFLAKKATEQFTARGPELKINLQALAKPNPIEQALGLRWAENSFGPTQTYSCFSLGRISKLAPQKITLKSLRACRRSIGINFNFAKPAQRQVQQSWLPTHLPITTYSGAITCGADFRRHQGRFPKARQFCSIKTRACLWLFEFLTIFHNCRPILFRNYRIRAFRERSLAHSRRSEQSRLCA